MNSLEKDSDIEEERRLCYVAVTRAKIKLYLVNAQMRIQFGQDMTNPESIFIKEINEDLLEKIVPEETFAFESRKTPRRIEKEEKYNKEEDVDINVGDNVYHEVFGQGKVVGISGSIASIAFKHPYGIKKLIKNHKSITKI